MGVVIMFFLVFGVIVVLSVILILDLLGVVKFGFSNVELLVILLVVLFIWFFV